MNIQVFIGGGLITFFVWFACTVTMAYKARKVPLEAVDALGNGLAVVIILTAVLAVLVRMAGWA